MKRPVLYCKGKESLVRGSDGARRLRHVKVVSISAPRTDRIYPQEIFQVFISFRS